MKAWKTSAANLNWAMLLALCLCLSLPDRIAALTMTFSPADPYLGDLPHARYYFWGVTGVSLPEGEEIESATLTFRNIWDWRVEYDQLYVHLIDSPTDSAVHDLFPSRSDMVWNRYLRSLDSAHNAVLTKKDYESGGDRFAGLGYAFTPWNDPVGGRPRNASDPMGPDLVFTIPTEYFGWLADGAFGFGIDPDCHYYNCGIVLQIDTCPSPWEPPPHDVPDSASAGWLLGLAASALAALRRLIS